MLNIASPSEVAEKLKISIPRVHKLLSQERIVGAYKIGKKRGTWIIPVNDQGVPEIKPAAKRPKSYSKIEI